MYLRKDVFFMAVTLMKLPYAYDALEPFIDEETMKFHHDKHHQTYVNNLNKLVEGTELEGKSAEEILTDLSAVPEKIRQGVINQGGGVYNHDLFWTEMAPEGSTSISEGVKKALSGNFGSLEDFKKKFSASAAGLFGSGWTWLVWDGHKLFIENTQNQDSPVSEGKKAILGLDVWEHAYYLKYQNRRADYIDAWWNVVNWDEVAERLGK